MYDFLVDGGDLALVRVIVVECLLELLGGGAHGVQGEEVVGDVVVETAGVEEDVVVVVVLLEELRCLVGGLGGDGREVVDAGGGGGEVEGAAGSHGASEGSGCGSDGMVDEVSVGESEKGLSSEHEIVA